MGLFGRRYVKLTVIMGLVSGARDGYRLDAVKLRKASDALKTAIENDGDFLKQLGEAQQAVALRTNFVDAAHKKMLEVFDSPARYQRTSSSITPRDMEVVLTRLSQAASTGYVLLDRPLRNLHSILRLCMENRSLPPQTLESVISDLTREASIAKSTIIKLNLPKGLAERRQAAIEHTLLLLKAGIRRSSNQPMPDNLLSAQPGIASFGTADDQSAIIQNLQSAQKIFSRSMNNAPLKKAVSIMEKALLKDSGSLNREKIMEAHKYVAESFNEHQMLLRSIAYAINYVREHEQALHGAELVITNYALKGKEPSAVPNAIGFLEKAREVFKRDAPAHVFANILNNIRGGDFDRLEKEYVAGYK